MKNFLNNIWKFISQKWKSIFLWLVFGIILLFFFQFFRYFGICERPDFNFADWLIRKKGWIVEIIIFLFIRLGFYRYIKAFVPWGSRRKAMELISILLSLAFGYLVYIVSKFFSCFWEFLINPSLWIS
jgi:hypothetical protein